MKAFKIAVWIDQNFAPEIGGGYSFQAQLIEKLDQIKLKNNIEICFAGFNLKHKFTKETINIPFTERYIELKRTNFYHKFFKSHAPRRDLLKNYEDAKKILKSNKVDLIFYCTPVAHIANFPFIIVNWDLGHKTTYPFPEMAMDGNWEIREKNIAMNFGKALIICCESEMGKQEVMKYYDIFPQKLKILSLFPGKLVAENITPKKPEWIAKTEKFFIYPAQFWAHKNHYNLVAAFAEFLKTNSSGQVKLILTGSDQGNQNYIKEVVKDLGCENNVIFSGFIEDDQLKWLYQNSMGLVFPSFLGPTNMPLLEANYLNCNIACSNLSGHQKMLGNNAIFFEPSDQNAILDAFKTLQQFYDQNEKLKKEELSTHYNLQNSVKQLEDIFSESAAIRKTWST